MRIPQLLLLLLLSLPQLLTVGQILTIFLFRHKITRSKCLTHTRPGKLLNLPLIPPHLMLARGAAAAAAPELLHIASALV